MILHHVGSPIRTPTDRLSVQIPAVFVCLRPSSPPCAKAFTLRSFLFDQKYFLVLNFIGSNGGGKEIRTPGLLRARQTLSQLSYTPIRNLDY